MSQVLSEVKYSIKMPYKLRTIVNCNNIWKNTCVHAQPLHNVEEQIK